MRQEQGLTIGTSDTDRISSLVVIAEELQVVTGGS